MHYSLHLIFSISLSKEKKKSQKNNFKKMLLFPFSFYHATHNFLIQKNVLIFISFPILSLSFFYFPRPLRQEREGRATTEGQQTREGGSATWLPAAWHFPHFIFRFIITEKSHRVSFYQSRYESFFSSHFGVLCFISFTFIRWGKLLVSPFTIEPKWCLERKTKNEKKKSFLKSYMKLEISNFYYHHRYYFLSSFLLDIFPSFLIFLQTAFRISSFFVKGGEDW